MAFTRSGISAGSTIASAQLLQVLRALEGDSGQGQPISLTALNSTSAYALDVRNLGSGGALRVKDTAGATIFNLSDSAATVAPTSGTSLAFTVAGAATIGFTLGANSSSGITVTGGAASAGQNLLVITPGAHTAMTAEKFDVNIAAHTNTITSGYTTQRFTLFSAPTISAASALTVTNAATVAISGAPATGGAGPAAITNAYALWVQAGRAQFDGVLGVNTSGVAIRDTSAAFDVTLAATSSAALTAGRTLTLDMGNVAHTLAFGTTANTITFPNAASGTVPLLNLAQSFTALQTFTAAIAVTGAVSFTTNVISTTALATPGALSATQFTGFASTVSGAAIMGYGTTNDVSLLNRAGTAVLGVTANTSNVTMAGALAITGALSGVTTLATSSTATFGGALTVSAGGAAITGNSSIAGGTLVVNGTSVVNASKLSVQSGITTDSNNAYMQGWAFGGNSVYSQLAGYTTTAITTAKTIFSAIDTRGVWLFVHGNDGTNYFADLIVTGYGASTITVINSYTEEGAPSARTYSKSANSAILQLAMASGTYAVTCVGLILQSR